MFDRKMRAAIDAFREGKPAAANRLLADAARAAGGASSGYIQVAKHLSERGHPQDAINFLDARLKKPDLAWDPMLWATLAEAAAKAGDTARAKQADEEAARRAGEIIRSAAGDAKGERDAVPRLLQAGLYYERRDARRAIEAFREALRRAPDDPITLNALGYTLADRGTTEGEFAEALQLTREALRRAPGEPMILDSYGWALFKVGKVKEARRVLREAVDAAPNEAELRYQLGLVYRALGLINEADNEFTRALRLRPNYAEAQKAKDSLRKPPGQGIIRGT